MKGAAMPADDHTHDHGSELSEMQPRVRALETIPTQKGYVDPAAPDQIAENVETKMGLRPAETPFVVAPRGPAGTEGWSEEALAALVTRDSMVGTGLPKPPEDASEAAR